MFSKSVLIMGFGMAKAKSQQAESHLLYPLCTIIEPNGLFILPIFQSSLAPKWGEKSILCKKQKLSEILFYIFFGSFGVKIFLILKNEFVKLQ